MPDSGAPKSALELAMEKLEAQQEFTVKKLTDQQRQEIAEIRRKYRARIADQELSLLGKIGEARSAGKFEEAEQFQANLKSELERLNREMEKAVEEVKKRD